MSPLSNSPTARPSIACATLYDEAYAPIGWLARNSLARYGRRHGYDVVVAHDCDSERPAAWHKIRLIQALLEQGYDYVLWMDADAIVVDPSADVANLIQPGKDLYLVSHPLPEYPASLPNTGLFLIRNSDWSRDLLERIWGLEQYIHGTWWENAAFMHLLGIQGLGEYGVNPQRCEIDTDPIEWLPDNWNRIHQPLSPGKAIIRHYAGKSRKHRIRQMAYRTNWPRALMHEYFRKPRAIDLRSHGIHSAMLEHDASNHSMPQDLKSAA